MVQTKKLTNKEILFIFSYINKEVQDGDSKKYPAMEFIDTLTTKVKWAFRKNYKAICDMQKLIVEEQQKINQKYMGDDKSDEEVICGEDGLPLCDDDGNEKKIRRVKPEFLDEYTKESSELSEQENEMSFIVISIDELPDNVPMLDLEALSFMIEE